MEGMREEYTKVLFKGSSWNCTSTQAGCNFSVGSTSLTMSTDRLTYPVRSPSETVNFQHRSCVMAHDLIDIN